MQSFSTACLALIGDSGTAEAVPFVQGVSKAGHSWASRATSKPQIQDVVPGLEGYNAVNGIRTEDAELAFTITAKVNEPAAPSASAGERHLVDRSGALPVFILKQHQRLTRHRRGQAKIREFNYLAGDRLVRGRTWGLRLRLHSTIEAEAMYPLK